MLSHQGVALFERIRRISRGLIGGSVSLGVHVEVSKAQASPNVALPLSAYGSGCSSQLLLQQLPECHHTSLQDDNGLNL